MKDNVAHCNENETLFQFQYNGIQYLVYYCTVAYSFPRTLIRMGNTQPPLQQVVVVPYANLSRAWGRDSLYIMYMRAELPLAI